VRFETPAPARLPGCESIRFTTKLQEYSIDSRRVRRRTTRPRSGDKRNAILAAATGIISEQGLSAPTAKIARAAGVADGSSLALALREIGRIERTLFMLARLEDPALRRRVTAGLNKGEARNSLARAVFFNRLGEIRDRSFENQRHRASGLNLVVAAITLWNTVYIERATEQMAKYGSSIPPCSSMSPRLAGNTSISPAITPGTPINGLPRVALDPSEAPETPPSLLSR
jgi:hypothetical protein